MLTKDSLIVITPQQLKKTNLIFLEHKKLCMELPELRTQIASYDNIMKSYVISDSLKNAQIERLKLHARVTEQLIQEQVTEISKLERRGKRSRNWAIGGVTVSASLLLILLLK